MPQATTFDQTRAELKEYKAARHARREAFGVDDPDELRRLMAEGAPAGGTGE
jgi:hypothetical protein